MINITYGLTVLETGIGSESHAQHTSMGLPVLLPCYFYQGSHFLITN